MVSRADGVGPKLAQRIVNELSEKVAKLSTSIANAENMIVPPTVSGQSTISQDAVSALVNLGYSQSEAWTAVQKASAKSDIDELGHLLNLALKEVGQ